jgi:thiosulfate reductase cytochrome b subunit
MGQSRFRHTLATAVNGSSSFLDPIRKRVRMLRRNYLTHRNVLFAGMAVIALIIAALGAYTALARPSLAPQIQASPLHPDFALLDETGANVLESGKPLSTMQTCGACHDTAFIESHAFHADQGLAAITEPGASVSNQPWDISNGLFGKFDPLTYRYLSPEGDQLLDLSTPEWLMVFGSRYPGGGPGLRARDGSALSGLSPDETNPETSLLDPQTGQPVAWDWSTSGTLEMNCLLCHTPTPNNTARSEEIQAGRFSSAALATLLGTGIVEGTPGNLTYNPQAFDENGLLKSEMIQIQDPSNQNCAQCHGAVHTDTEVPFTLQACDLDQRQTATTGQVISPQRINESGLNLTGKKELSRSWDIHAERGLQCTDCHYALNNPQHYQEIAGTNPDHLVYDPRRLEIGEYLLKPDHNFARGQSAQFTVSPETKGSMRRCESCHDAQATHSDWLPYVDRHMEVVACETCHIPTMHAPAIQAYDWTVIHPDGSPRTECRGIEGQDTVTDLVTGFTPVLMERTGIDGDTLLAPYNLLSSWFWVYQDSNGSQRPVRKADLESAFLVQGDYAPEIVAAFDADADGQLSAGELRIDNEQKETVVAARLEALGLNSPEIYGQVQPYSINHSIARGEAVTRDCQACHHEDSILAAPIVLSAGAPGGVTPQFVKDSNVAPSGELAVQAGALVYTPAPEADGIYIFGHNRVSWVDWFGALAFLGTLAAVFIHGSIRLVNGLRRPKHPKHVKEVYMYDAYERLWHWMQTFAIIILLLTGMVIHRPDMFGMFSFRYMVTIHNILAAILVINAGLSLFWHLASGEIRQFIPRPYGFFDNAIVQAKYYMQGIFKSGEHPFEKTKQKKLNPLQQVTYFGLLNVLLPLQIITGALMWGVQQFTAVAALFGGLPILAPFHSLVAWLFASFIVGHVYLTTTGVTVFDDIRAMVTGWEHVEVTDESEQEHPSIGAHSDGDSDSTVSPAPADPLAAEPVSHPVD